MHGRTVVTVLGHYFIDQYHLTCQFGTHGTVNGTLGSSTLVRCVSPSASVTGSISLEISNNNQQFSASMIAFEYQANASVMSLNITHGPACMSRFVQLN